MKNRISIILTIILIYGCAPAKKDDKSGIYKFSPERITRKFAEYSAQKISDNDFIKFLDYEIRNNKARYISTKKLIQDKIEISKSNKFEYNDYDLVNELSLPYSYDYYTKNIYKEPDLSNLPPVLQKKADALWKLTRKINQLNPVLNAFTALGMLTLEDKESIKLNNARSYLYPADKGWLLSFELPEKVYLVQINGNMDEGWLPVKCFVYTPATSKVHKAGSVQTGGILPPVGWKNFRDKQTEDNEF